MRIDRVGNIGHVHTGEQRALTGLVGNPLTASHEMNATVVVKLALAVEDARGQVMRTAVAWQQPAVVAHVSIRRAVERVVTDARSRPHVVHRPYHRFATLDNAADALERQEALIDPRQVNDVGLLKLRQFRNVETRVGDVNLKEPLTMEMQMAVDAPAFPKEMQLLAQPTLESHYGDAVCLLMHNQHLGLHTVVVECIHQTVGGHGGTTHTLTRIHD